MVTTPWSENFPLQGITFPHGGSSWVGNGLNNLGWETWVYELGPLRGQAHSFHGFGWGWNFEPPAWDRRSLLTGSSRGGPSSISGNHTLPGYRGAISNSRTRSRWTLSRTPGSRAIREDAHRQSLGHVCTFASSPLFRGAGCVSENQSGKWDVSRGANRSTRASISAPPPQGGASIPPDLSPSRQDVCSYILGHRDVSCSKRQQLPLGPQEDLGWSSQYGTLGQEPRFLPHYQGTKASLRVLDHAKGVAPWGKPFGPEPPL